MKKLKLQALKLGAKEVLTRDQLKNVMGGAGSTDCIADGNPCEWFRHCCNVCRGFGCVS